MPRPDGGSSSTNTTNHYRHQQDTTYATFSNRLPQPGPSSHRQSVPAQEDTRYSSTDDDQEPIDPCNPFGPTRWASSKRYDPSYTFSCKWRIVEKPSVWDLQGPAYCNRQYSTAHFLARHLLQEHILATRSQRSARVLCRWDACQNRSYQVEDLKRHLVYHHLQAKAGLKYACPFLDCASCTVIKTEEALDYHIAKYHPSYMQADLKPIFGLIKQKNKPPIAQPPLPEPGSKEDRQLCAIQHYPRLVIPNVTPAALVTDAELEMNRLRSARLELRLEEGDEDFLAPWPWLHRRLKERSDRIRAKQESDTTVQRGVFYKASHLKEQRNWLVEVLVPEDPIQSAIQRAIAQAQPYQSTSRGQRSLVSEVVVINSPERRKESLDSKTIRKLMLDDEYDEQPPLTRVAVPARRKAQVKVEQDASEVEDDQQQLALALPSQLRRTPVRLSQSPHKAFSIDLPSSSSRSRSTSVINLGHGGPRSAVQTPSFYSPMVRTPSEIPTPSIKESPPPARTITDWISRPTPPPPTLEPPSPNGTPSTLLVSSGESSPRSTTPPLTNGKRRPLSSQVATKRLKLA